MATTDSKKMVSAYPKLILNSEESSPECTVLPCLHLILAHTIIRTSLYNPVTFNPWYYSFEKKWIRPFVSSRPFWLKEEKKTFQLRLAGADIQKQTFSKVCFSNFELRTSWSGAMMQKQTFKIRFIFFTFHLFLFSKAIERKIEDGLEFFWVPIHQPNEGKKVCDLVLYIHTFSKSMSRLKNTNFWDLTLFNIRV